MIHSFIYIAQPWRVLTLTRRQKRVDNTNTRETKQQNRRGEKKNKKRENSEKK